MPSVLSAAVAHLISKPKCNGQHRRDEVVNGADMPCLLLSRTIPPFVLCVQVRATVDMWITIQVRANEHVIVMNMKDRVNIRISRRAYDRLLALRFKSRKKRLTIIKLVDDVLKV